MNKLFIDKKYIGIIAGYLNKFSWVSRDKASFRCNVCGDSKKNPNKRRGAFLPWKGQYFVKCQNCGFSSSLGKYIEEYFPAVFPEYKLELLKGGESGLLTEMPKIETEEPTIKKSSLSSVNDLSPDHPAIAYLVKRKIPRSKWKDIKFTDNYNQAVWDTFGLEKYLKRLPEEPRIVFEMKSDNGRVFGLQGRSIRESKWAKYITIKPSEALPKIYGMHGLNKELPIFLLEGAVDSLFLPNSISVCGGDVPEPAVFERMKIDPERIYVCLDNEPRHRDTVARMKSAIINGYKVCFWSFDSRLKDVNDMILAGVTTKQILTDIKQNSVSGLEARARFAVWNKRKGRK